MKFELLVIPDCPHVAAAAELFRIALADVGLTREVMVRQVTDLRAAPPGFAGSPTFLADGVDLIPTTSPLAGLTCRIYRSQSGSSGLPDLASLRQALKRAADPARTAAT